MERLLEKIIQCKENGLYFVNTPTGSAKSYSAVQLMKNHYKDFDSHFIFITNNLNNLPMEDLEKVFVMILRIKLSALKVLWIILCIILMKALFQMNIND